MTHGFDSDVQRAWVSLFVSTSYYIILTHLFWGTVQILPYFGNYDGGSRSNLPTPFSRSSPVGGGGEGVAKTQFFYVQTSKKSHQNNFQTLKVMIRADQLAKISNCRPCLCHYILSWNMCFIQRDLMRGLDIHAYDTRGTGRHRTVVFKRLSSQAVAQFVKKLPI